MARARYMVHKTGVKLSLSQNQKIFWSFKIYLINPVGEHITDIYIIETGTTELENLSHNIIDIFIIET